LTRIVGKAKALNMILFSTRINPQQALEIGLVNQLSTPDQLMADALEFAEKLVKRPPLAVGCVLKAISAGEYEGFKQGLKIEEEGSAIVGKSKDCVEGFSAFLEKREPVFKGEQVGMRKWEWFEFGIRNAEFGMRNRENEGRRS
jgi:enoyl-CoA hydratase/carnithine racemase